jgi:hypothetical protein
MMVENKNTIFENWLAAYGSHLEELAGAKLSGASESDAPSQALESLQDERTQ